MNTTLVWWRVGRKPPCRPEILHWSVTPNSLSLTHSQVLQSSRKFYHGWSPDSGSETAMAISLTRGNKLALPCDRFEISGIELSAAVCFEVYSFVRNDRWMAQKRIVFVAQQHFESFQWMNSGEPKISRIDKKRHWETIRIIGKWFGPDWWSVRLFRELVSGDVWLLSYFFGPVRPWLANIVPALEPKTWCL